ncbi:MAG: M15 family metallopeptidase [Prevotella sp.]|nr:M15 family metallopeptidase [Prevotella sp.]
MLMNRIRILLMLLLTLCATVPVEAQVLSADARRMAAQGLKNIADEAPEVRISLMYTRADNFTGRVLYTSLREAYLHPITMKALKKADERLRQLRPDLRLMVMDATRPMSVQQKMWDAVKNTNQKIYVSNPKNGGGLHNYGLAVDLTLCDLNGDTLTMGVKIDNMTSLSHIDKEGLLLKQGKISREAYDNRRLLREVMRYAGFKPLRTEWWHFNIRTRAQAKQYFKVVE